MTVVTCTYCGASPSAEAVDVCNGPIWWLIEHVQRRHPGAYWLGVRRLLYAVATADDDEAVAS